MFPHLLLYHQHSEWTVLLRYRCCNTNNFSNSLTRLNLSFTPQERECKYYSNIQEIYEHSFSFYSVTFFFTFLVAVQMINEVLILTLERNCYVECIYVCCVCLYEKNSRIPIPKHHFIKTRGCTCFITLITICMNSVGSENVWLQKNWKYMMIILNPVFIWRLTFISDPFLTESIPVFVPLLTGCVQHSDSEQEFKLNKWLQWISFNSSVTAGEVKMNEVCGLLM